LFVDRFPLPQGLSPLFYQDDQISFFPLLLLEGRPRGKVRHKHNKSPRKPGMVSCSEVQVSARYIDADLGGFWARSRCLFHWTGLMELYGGSQAAEPPSKTRKKRKKGQKGLGVPTEKLEML